MRMLEPTMLVHVGMRLPRRIGGAVRVPAMLVVNVSMCMRHGIVRMLVFVVLAHMQPHTKRHERAGHDQLHRHRLAEHRHR